MAKARSRSAARKIKDRWKSKRWYDILAPPSFDNVTVAETLADNPEKIINRVTEVSLQDLTNDFRKSHIKLFFKVHTVEENNAKTYYIGHTLTSDYLRRMIRRKRSKIEAVYDIRTKDGAKLRIKPFATTDRRIQNSQKRAIRDTMKKTITIKARKTTLSAFIKSIIDGRLGSEIYKSCKTLYPVKRIEIFKTEVIQQPTIEIEEEKTETEKQEPSTKKQEDSPKPSDDKESTETDSDSEEEKEISEEELTDEESEDAEKETNAEELVDSKEDEPEEPEESDETEEPETEEILPDEESKKPVDDDSEPKSTDETQEKELEGEEESSEKKKQTESSD